MDKITQQTTHFDSISKKYFESRKKKNHLLLKHLMWSEFFARNNLNLGESFSVLEPMCGYGEGKKLVEQYISPNFFYEGFDYSTALVKLVTKEQPGINIRVMDVTKFEADDRRFDLIMLIGGLHHVYEHAGNVVQRLSTSLRPGGYFVNFEPTHNFFVFRKIREYIYKKNTLFDAETEQGFRLSELNRFFYDNNFELVDQLYPGLLSYVLYYNPDAFPSLDLGSTGTVQRVYKFDRLFFRSIVGRKLSFATLTLWKKSGELVMENRSAY